MRINKITIKNYRSFDSTGIEIQLPDLRTPFSVIGHNNSGKSNFIDVLAMCLGARSFSRHTFSFNDFYLKKSDHPILAEAIVNNPLKSSDAYNQVKEMPVFQLKIEYDDGVLNVSHYFCDEDGKQIFNPRSIRRSKKKEYSEEEREILNETQKQGAEQVWKWRSKVPAYFIDTAFIQSQLKINRYTLLGKVMGEIKANFEADTNIMPRRNGVVKAHIGKPRKQVFDNAMQYLEDFVLSTDNFDDLISSMEEVIKKQLEIENDDISLKFGFPTADSFFDNLTFYITDNPQKPKLPIDQMGKGFSSLFVIALFRAILNADDEGGNIFIIEEPETFLHEHFQEYFYNVLCNLAEKNQVIYTTHSKKFVNIFKPQSIIKLKNENYLKTKIVYKKSPKIKYPERIDRFEVKNPDDFSKYLRTLEPNLGNIIFASKVLIVEGPDDLLAYKTAFVDEVNFGLDNIAIISVWGKEPIVTVVQLCKRFDIPFFVIHDWDLDDKSLNITNAGNDENQSYQSLGPGEKAQYTNNHKIFKEVGDLTKIHHNKKKLETVLNISDQNKGPVSVYAALKEKSLDNILEEYPDFIDKNILEFLNIDKNLPPSSAEPSKASEAG